MPFQKVRASWKSKIRSTNLSTTTKKKKKHIHEPNKPKNIYQNHKNRNYLKRKPKNEKEIL
jgi:hypothetical protein